MAFETYAEGYILPSSLRFPTPNVNIEGASLPTAACPYVKIFRQSLLDVPLPNLLYSDVYLIVYIVVHPHLIALS